MDFFLNVAPGVDLTSFLVFLSFVFERASKPLVILVINDIVDYYD